MVWRLGRNLGRRRQFWRWRILGRMVRKMSDWNSVYTWPELVDALDFQSDLQGAAATHTFPPRTKAPRGLWDDEKEAVGKLWTSQNGGAQWQLRHEAPGRIVVVQSFPSQILAVRALYAADRNPPLKHQLETFGSGGGAPQILGILPELVVGIGFISPERGFAWAAKNILWTDTAGRAWSKVAQRTPDAVVARIQSVRPEGTIYYIRDKRVYRHPSGANVGERVLGGMANAQAETVCVDRDKDTVVVAAKEGKKWVCGFYEDDQPKSLETIEDAPLGDTQVYLMHAARGDVTFITITTRSFLPEYASFRRTGGRWHREDIGGARNFGALAFAGARAWVSRRSASEPATRLYRR